MSAPATFEAGAYLHHLDSISEADLADMTAAELRLLLTISRTDMSKQRGWRRVGTATVTVTLDGAAQGREGGAS